MAQFPLLGLAFLCLISLVVAADIDPRTWGFFNRRPQCGTTSRTIRTVLSNPAGQSGDCQYTIRANSRRVCQLRLDFDLNLAQPVTTAARPYPHCANDALVVDGLNVEICGQNSGQHIYVPWNVQRLFDTKLIRIRIADRRTNTALPAATWRITVTQVECQESGWFGRDSPLRAPTGCLQYFTERSGTVESFNYNGRLGPYLGGLTYGICFRRQSNQAELRLQAEFFQMSQNVATAAGYDADCSPQVITAQSRQDFLAIREASFTTAASVAMVANRFCGSGIAQGQTITTRSPGPFMIVFSTDQQTSAEERGFRFTYNIV